MNETLADSEQSVSSLTTIMKNCRLEDGDLIVNHQVTEERCSQLSQQKQVMEENNPKRKRSRPEFYKSTEENNVKSKRTRPEFYKGTDYHNRISDWSNREKEQLLTAMKKHGYLNMRELCRAVPTKSKDEMKIFIGLWFEMSSNTLTHGKIHLLVKNAFKPYSMDSSNTSEKCPVDQWLEKLESAQPASGYNEVECLPIAKSFLFISKFERHPPPDECGGIDFRSLYEYIYCMLCGYPARSLSPPTAKLLLDSVQELAQGMKEQGLSKESEFLDRVQRVSYNEGGKVRQYSGKKIPPKSPEIHDIMESCMRSLMELRGFNPLNVPLELLKMSK